MTDEEYQDVRDCFELAMRSEDIDEEVIKRILTTVDDAVDNNMDKE